VCHGDGDKSSRNREGTASLRDHWQTEESAMAVQTRRKASAAPTGSAAPAGRAGEPAVLRISSRNYSSWSMRGWLLCRMAGLDFVEDVVSPDDPLSRAELLLQSSSILIPCLRHQGAELWDTLAIAGYLNELHPEARMLPADRLARARSRAISGEMHAGFAAMRSTLPMNLRGHVPNFTLWSGARSDIERIFWIWRDSLERWGGPWLCGPERSIADAMYAPVVTRFRTYDVKLDATCEAYVQTILGWPDVVEWTEAAKREPEAAIAELDLEAEF
jgi:glutathione S-transferase